MARVLMISDTHGDWGERLPKLLEVEAVFHMGDAWDVHRDREIPTHIIRGNHELEDRWLTPGKNVTLHEDYSVFEFEGRKFGVLGRMDEEAHAHLYDIWLGDVSNRSFDKDVEKLKAMGQVDVLLLHDTPHPYVYGGEVGGSRWLNKVIEVTRPKLVFHGHAHEVRTARRVVTDEPTIVVGLPALDKDFNLNGYAILDTEALDFTLHVRYKRGRAGVVPRPITLEGVSE